MQGVFLKSKGRDLMQGSGSRPAVMGACCAHTSITPIYTLNFLHDERRRPEHAIAGHNRARRTLGDSTATVEGHDPSASHSDTSEPHCRTVRTYLVGC